MFCAVLDLIRQRGLPALGAALLAWPLLAMAQVDPPGRVGRVADLQGTVWVYDGEGGSWIAAHRNRPVTHGDRFATERDAQTELRVGSTALLIDGASEVEMLHLDDEVWRIQLHKGAVALRVQSRELAADIEIVTVEGAFQPLSGGHYRVDRVNDTSFAGVWRGELRMHAQDNLRVVNAGERVEVWRDDTRGFARTRTATMPSDRLSAWALAADQQAQRSAASRYVSPEMTGVEELDQYGRWEQHPEHGAVWAPTAVPPGWAPYRDGRWAWIRPWGWTWVDAAPWGFAPFHYGRWVSWRGRWAWWPGAYVERPVFAPALVAWIGGPHIGVSISIGGPTVGWVPLAPREVYRPGYRVTPIYVERINRGHDHRRDDDWRRDDRRRKPEPQVPTGPVMYSNQGVPGAVTVVPSNVLRARQPVAAAVVPQVAPAPDGVRPAQPMRPVAPVMAAPTSAPERAMARGEERRDERGDRRGERRAEPSRDRPDADARPSRGDERAPRKGRDDTVDDVDARTPRGKPEARAEEDRPAESRRDQRRREQAK